MLSTYLFILRRYPARLLAISVLFASIILALLSVRPPVYQSVAVLSVGVDSVAADVLGQNRYQEPERRVATELETLRSRPVAEAAAELLAQQGRPASVAEVGRSVEAQARGESNYLEVVGEAQRSVRAQELTEAVVTSYLEYRRGVGREQLQRLETELEERLVTAERELAAIPDEESRDRGVAQQRVDRAQELLEAVRLRLSVETTDVQLVAGASTPQAPVGRLSLPVSIAVSLVAGALLAIAVLLALELLRDRVRTPAEATHVTGVPVLAHLGARRRAGTRPGDHSDVDSGAVRSLRLAMTTAHARTFPKQVLVVGPEGDAERALEAARKLARGCTSAGMKVLLMADLDDGDVHSASGWAARELSVAGIDWRRVTGTPATGAGWLDAADPESELARLSAEHDTVILAAPEPAAVEPLALAPLFSSVLVVVTVGQTAARPLRRLVERLDSAGSGPDGLVVVERVRRRRRKRMASEPPPQGADAVAGNRGRTVSASVP